MRAEMIPIFCLLPADMLLISLFCPIISPFMKSSYCLSRSFIVSFERLLTFAINSKYSSGERKSMRKLSSIYAPVYTFHSSPTFTSVAKVEPSGLLNFMFTVPQSAFRRSRASLKSVVFPAPLFPTRPSRVLPSTVSLSMSTAVFSPKVFFRLSKTISIR